MHKSSVDAAVDAAGQVDSPDAARVELHAQFLAFVANKVSAGVLPEAHTALLLAALKSFTTEYLSKIDVHTLTSAYDLSARKDVLSAYFLALTVLESHKIDVPRAPSSALLAAAAKGDASVYALFGGQGTNEVYFDELQTLYDIYKPYVADFVATVSKSFEEYIGSAPGTTASYYTHGLNVLAWLEGTVPRPPVAYLASIPVSFPLIGLSQLIQYLVTCRVANLSPGDMRSALKGATGHSQGIISAICIAASTSYESYAENARKALKWLFFCGLRGQEAFPVLSIEPSIIKDAVDGGEGTPSPMLAITGLALNTLESHIKTTNKFLPTNSQLHISLYNGPKAFVVTGPARALFGLVTSLRKIKAPSGLDQSKVPFSQRKTVFSIRFLVVGVPYHSEYLKGAADKVCDVDLAGEELWQPTELGISVFHTEDGARPPMFNCGSISDLFVMQALTFAMSRPR